ncbi:MAG: YCF48-related protein [Candidatus Kapaibacterium sp.]
MQKVKKIFFVFFVPALFAGASLAQTPPSETQSLPQGWYQQQSGTTDYIGYIFFIDKDTGWVNANGHLLGTVNGGVSWTLLALQGVGWPIFFDGTNGIGFTNKVMRTTDGGKSWVPKGTISPVTAINGSVQFFGVDTIRVYNGFDQLFSGSNDGGNTWFYQSAGINGALYGAMYFLDGRNGFLCSNLSYWQGSYPPPMYTEGGEFAYTAKGGSPWIEKYCSVNENLDAIIATNTKNIFCATDHGNIVHSIDGGIKWDTVHFGNNVEGYDKFYFVNPKLGYVVGDPGKIVFTSDSGKTWSYQNSTVTTELNDVFFIDSLTGWVCGDQGVILRTTNGGFNWVRQYLPLPLEVRAVPEPFATKTTLSYSIPKAANVSVKFYDVLGKEVYHISSDGIQSEGAHSIEISGDHLPGGVYYFILTAGEFTGTGKVTKITP